MSVAKSNSLWIRKLGLCAYQPVWEAMKQFTQMRDETTADELWLVEHDPVFTQGQAGKPEHILNAGNIPVVQSDRGGQITYHGPGQLVAYALFDLRRLKINVRTLVTQIEQAVIDLLADYGIAARSRCDAPGVYVTSPDKKKVRDNNAITEAKICSLGLRVRKGCSYHGLALNVNLDLKPFSQINPCGFSQMPITQMSHFIHGIEFAEIETKICEHIARNFGYNTFSFQSNERFGELLHDNNTLPPT